MQPILFPAVDSTLVAALGAVLAPVPVSTKVPNPRPVTFVIVRRVGGTRAGLVADEALITVEAWADTDPAAHDLAQIARARLGALEGTVAGGVTIYRVGESSGPQDLPDPDSNQSRYTQTFTVTVRGTPI